MLEGSKEIVKEIAVFGIIDWELEKLIVEVGEN